MSNQHVLKIHPAPLADLLSGAKTAEVRRNDRDFQVGDTVRLMEVNPETGNWTGAADQVCTITHIQTGYGLPDDMCVLSYGKVGHDYKAHWMGFMDRTDWMQEKGQVPAKYLGQHRADILTDMLREAREALARAGTERDDWKSQACGIERVANDNAHTASVAQAQLAQAVGLLEHAMESSSFREILTLERDIAAFLARHAQSEQHVCDKQGEDVCHDDACPYHGTQAAQQEAGNAEMARHSLRPENQRIEPVEPLRVPHPLEAQGAQAGDEHENFEAWHRSVVAGDPPHEKYHDGSYVNQHVNRYWTGWSARAALATQPAAEQLWAVHAQGPDDLFAAFSREDAEAHAAAFNALPCPPGISVSAVVIESPWPTAEHWKYLAEQWKYLADKEQESNSPPAAAHGDEAVRKDAVAAYVDMSCNSVLIDGATCYYLPAERMAAFDRMFSLGDAMRAQGDGEVQ